MQRLQERLLYFLQEQVPPGIRLAAPWEGYGTLYILAEEKDLIELPDELTATGRRAGGLRFRNRL